jgi:hypothetical protein
MTQQERTKKHRNGDREEQEKATLGESSFHWQPHFIDALDA